MPSIESELGRVKRVADQMITGHAILRDRYVRRSLVLDSALLVASTFVAVTTFVPETTLHSLIPGISDPVRTVQFVATMVFILSIVQLRVNWKSRGANHSDAVRALSTIKVDANKAQISLQNGDTELAGEVLAKYRTLNESIVPIPDNQFNSLKSAHLRKVALSKLISKNPLQHVLLIKAKVAISLICRRVRQ